MARFLRPQNQRKRFVPALGGLAGARLAIVGLIAAVSALGADDSRTAAGRHGDRR